MEQLGNSIPLHDISVEPAVLEQSGLEPVTPTAPIDTGSGSGFSSEWTNASDEEFADDVIFGGAFDRPIERSEPIDNGAGASGQLGFGHVANFGPDDRDDIDDYGGLGYGPFGRFH